MAERLRLSLDEGRGPTCSPRVLTDVPQQAAVSVDSIADRVKVQANGRAREPGPGVRACNGAARLDAYRVVRSFGRVHGESRVTVSRATSIRTRMVPTIDDALAPGARRGLRRRRPCGQPCGEDGQDVEARANRPHAVTRSRRCTSRADSIPAS